MGHIPRRVLEVPRSVFLDWLNNSIYVGQKLYHRTITWNTELNLWKKDINEWHEENIRGLTKGFRHDGYFTTEYMIKLTLKSVVLKFNYDLSDVPDFDAKVQEIRNYINEFNDLLQNCYENLLVDEDFQHSIRAKKGEQTITELLPPKIINSKFNAGFIIHGHDIAKKLEVARFIDIDLRKKAVILHEQVNKGMTIIEKFEENSQVDFAVAIWTADDEGKAKGEQNLKRRARQNVIFETGFFIGKLGRKNVIILYEQDVSMISDYSGVVYIPLNGNWKYELHKEINEIYK
jgi:hypothetical protein